MCARYSLSSPVTVLQKLFGFASEIEAAARFNIAPSTEILTVVDEGGHRRGRGMVWGLPAPKESSAPIINVRAESADTNPLFRQAIGHHGLVLADGFFEWREEGTVRQPYYFQLPDHQPFGMAALFEPGPGGPPRCALLTMPASEDVAPIHDRMPVILTAGEAPRWLNAGRRVADALAVARGVRLQRSAVDTAVNDVRREGPELLQPPRQGRLI